VTAGGATIFERHTLGPVLTAQDWPYPVNAVMNAGATRLDDGTALVCRVEDRRGISHLSLARSRDGVSSVVTVFDATRAHRQFRAVRRRAAAGRRRRRARLG